MKRDNNFDALKAFAIFLVVLGHFVQSTIINYDDNLLFKFIYSFHMPLFIFISGYLTFKSEKVSNSFVKSRFISLLIPYFSWMLISTLYFTIKNDVTFWELLVKSLFYPDNGLWFLWVLFFMHILYYFSKKLLVINSIFSMFFVFIIGLLLSFIFKIDNIFAFKTFISLLPYYILGLLANKYQTIFKNIFNKWLLILPFFLILVYFWQRNNAIEINFTFNNSKFFIFIYKSVVAIMGIIVSVGIIKQFKNFNKHIIYLGKNTLPIYAMNFYFLYALDPLKDYLQGSFYYIFAFILSLLIIIFSLLIAKILNMNKLFSFILLGVKNRN